MTPFEKSVAKAEAIATEIHAGQVDKAGQPYIDHLRRVVIHLRTRWPNIAAHVVQSAWLHDAFEDTSVTIERLLIAGVEYRAIEIIEQLTKPPRGVDYQRWIARIAGRASIDAIKVKIADNMDNSDPVRVATIPEGPAMLKSRYEPARQVLEAALVRRTSN